LAAAGGGAAGAAGLGAGLSSTELQATTNVLATNSATEPAAYFTKLFIRILLESTRPLDESASSKQKYFSSA
jgi:hypothetical protein